MKLQYLVILIAGVHFVADFIVQTHKQSINKSKSNWWLTEHIVTYTLCLCVLLPFTHWWFPLVNGAAHWITDYFTSRWTSRLWEDGKVKRFFVVIGFDQFLHYTVLFLTI